MRGGILWEGDITNNETQTGEGRTPFPSLHHSGQEATCSIRSPGPTHCSPSIVSLSAASGPLLPFYEPPVGQRKKTRQRGICRSTCFCRERRGTSTFHRTEHLKASVVRVNHGSNVSTWKPRKRVKPGGAKASCRKEPIKTYQSSLSGPEPCICNTVEDKYFDCSV